MITFGGTIFYIDFDEIDKLILIKQAEPDKEITKVIKNSGIGERLHEIQYEKYKSNDKQVDLVKYDTLQRLLDIILVDDAESDDDSMLGYERALEKRGLAYQIAFNTLIKYNILKEN